MGTSNIPINLKDLSKKWIEITKHKNIKSNIVSNNKTIPFNYNAWRKSFRISCSSYFKYFINKKFSFMMFNSNFNDIVYCWIMIFYEFSFKIYLIFLIELGLLKCLFFKKRSTKFKPDPIFCTVWEPWVFRQLFWLLSFRGN